MIYQAGVGQAAKVLLPVQFVADDGTPATPTSPTVTVYGGSPLVVKATPALVEVVTGLMVAELDVSNATLFPSGQYLIRYTGTTSALPTATVDTLQIAASPYISSSGVIGSSYTDEDRIRNVNELLDENHEKPDTDAVALEAQRAAAIIDGKLMHRYTVPFTAPFPAYIVVLNDWLAAANLLDRFYGANANMSEHAKELRKWVYDMLDDLATGEAVLPGVTPVTTSGGMAVSQVSKQISDTMPGIPQTRKQWRR